MKKYFIFLVILLLICTSFPYMSAITNSKIESSVTYENNDILDTKDDGKGEWKTNYFCRIKASGVGFVDFEVLGTTLNFWIGPCRKVELYLYDGYCKISGIKGTDVSNNTGYIDLEADFFCGIILFRWASWASTSYMNGFALKCRYKF